MTGDCNDANAALNPATKWYKDADNDGYSDGYSDGTIIIQCTQPANYKLATALTATSGDCNDSNAAINFATIWILDADSDGYYPGTPLVRCTSPGVGYIIRSTQRSGDCLDNNASVNPGAVEVCGNKIDDNCNIVVDEAICYPCQNANTLRTTNITASSVQVNWYARVNQIQWQVQFKTTKLGSKRIDVLVTGNKRLIVITGLLSNQNYLWQIRARCSNCWTASSSVGFTTLKSTAIALIALSKKVQTSATEPAVLKVSPNPSGGFINMDLQVGNNLSSTAMLSLFDLSGRRFYTEKTGVINGMLRKRMQLPWNVASGTYILEVLVNNASYTSKLVLIR